MKRLLYILTGISVMLLGSCVNNDARQNSANTLHLSVSVKGLSAETATRATIPAEPGEDQIGSLYLIFFEPDNLQNGMFIDYVEVANPGKMNLVIDLSAYPALSISNAYNILAIANISDTRYLHTESDGTTVDAWMEWCVGKTQRQAMSGATAVVAGSGSNNDNAILPSELLMSASIVKESGQINISFILERNVARFDVYNIPNESYDLMSASIWNAYPVATIWGGGVMDFSASGVRLSRFYGVDNSSNSTEIEGADGAGEILNNIIGGLYCFENMSATPVQNDKLTTCIIVGLRNRAEGTTSYYRVNMHQGGSAQMLLPNYVYRLTITGVAGPGYATEELAYNGRGNNLLYIVNQWNLDDNGLIVKDEYSLLSLPTKTINIGREGGDFDYSMFISSKLPNPGPLSILSQTYNPADNGIVSSINGNILHVVATPLAPHQTERRGIVMLSYAGLQTYINIVQSGDAETFLKVIMPDGGIPAFPSYSNAFSGMVTVDASGPWTAKIYMPGFSFTQGQLITEIRSTDVAYVNNNQFRIYTNTANPDTSTRSAFIVVTLDSDPDNYSSVVRVAQKAAGAIKVLPDQAIVTFNGTGALTTATPPATNVNIFNVQPALVDTGSIEYIPDWNCTILVYGSYDDRSMFSADIVSKSTSNPIENIVLVKAEGLNLTGRTANATLRIFLTDDPGTYTDIQLAQQPLQWSVPSVATAITAAGGTTAELNLTISAPGLHYTVEVVNLTPSTLSSHFAYLIDPDEGGNIQYSKLKARDVSQKFIVGFPKLIWPNIDLQPQVTVRVTLIETGEVKTFTVSQSAIVQKPVNVLNIGDSWGRLSNTSSNSTWSATWNSSYNANFVTSFSTASNYGPAGTIKTTSTGVRLSSASNNSNFNTVWPIVQSAVTFVHLTQPTYTLNNIASNNLIWGWMNSSPDVGVAFINTEGATSYANSDFNSYIPGQLGLTGTGSHNYTYRVNTDVIDNKVMQYLLNGPFGAVATTQTFTTSGTTSRIDTASVANVSPHAVPVLTVQTFCALMIDPSRNVLVKVDSEMTTGSTNSPVFWRNVLAYAVNNAQYGSYFTDYFWDSPRSLMTAPQVQQ